MKIETKDDQIIVKHIYNHVSSSLIAKTPSPINLLNI